MLGKGTQHSPNIPGVRGPKHNSFLLQYKDSAFTPDGDIWNSILRHVHIPA